MIEYRKVSSDRELKQILALQQQNHKSTISHTEAKKEGFVTVQHDMPLLRRLNSPHPHIIAKNAEEVVGYTLVMLPEMRDSVPVLIPMFDIIDNITYNGKALKSCSYFVMGQVCVHKEYRSSGVFAKMYSTLFEVMKEHYDLLITEISSRNARSLRAHEKVGFKRLHTYQDKDDWVVVIKDLKA